MVLELVVDFGYNIVESSWAVSTILVKYILAFHVLAALRNPDITLESFKEVLDNYSRLTVSSIVLLGIFIHLLGVSVEPVFLPLFSEGLAWLYLGYLFWEF